MTSKESTFIYGRHPVLELLSAPSPSLTAVYVMEGGPAHGPKEAIISAATAQNIPIEYVDRAALGRMVGHDAVHQGVAARMRAHSFVELEALCAPPGETLLLVMLDQVQDPHNLGALARSALAFGAHGLIIGKDRSAPLSAVAMKAAAGALAHLPVAQVVNLRRALTQLQKRGLWVVGTLPEGDTVLDAVDLTLPTVLVVGSEGRGLRPSTAALCDVRATIPMQTIGSLNASVAGAICLYEAARQRQRHSFVNKP